MTPRILFWTIAVVSLCGALWSVAEAQEAVSPKQPSDSADLKRSIPAYTRIERLPGEITLAVASNGLTVIVQENHVAPVATIRCFVKNTGSAFEGRWLGAGLSHVLEHVVAGGTTTHRSEKEIQRIVSSFGGATNAFTSTDMTTFFIDCPAKNTPAAIELVADSMQHIRFEPAEFARELKVVRRELADGETDRGRVLGEMLDLTIYRESPARHPIIGYLEVLNRTTNQTIIDFYHQRYVPNNQVFVVVGDVKPKEVLDQVARQWAGTARSYDTVVPMPGEPEQIAPREALREMDGATYDIALAWPTVKLSDPDLYALDLAAYILGEGESSRLVRRLKYDRQVVLSVHADSNTPWYVRGWFGVFASAQPETRKTAVDEILREVYRLRDEPVAAAELAKAKKQKAAELVFDQQTVQRAADSLGRSMLSAGDPQFDRRYVEEIQKVSAEQIRDVAQRYFTPQRLNRVVIAPPGGLPKQKPQAAGAEEGKVRLVKLDNGLRVLVKRHPNLPLVNIQAYVLGGTLVETPQTAGLSSLVAEMLDKGTATRNAAEIAEYFDSVGGRFSTAAGRNTVYTSASVLSADFSQTAAILAESFLHPTFPQDQFEKVKSLALGMIASRADDSHQELMELFADSLPDSSPYHILSGGKAETVRPMTVEDLRAYHARYFVPENMIVSVFGDIDPETALASVRRHFGGLKASGAPPAIDFHRSNAIPQDVVRHKKTGKATGMVLLGYPDPSIFDKQDHAAMVLLDAITSGYRYPGGWLHNELRGAGLVYFVDAMQMTGPAPGYFIVIAQTQPAKIAEVVQRIERDLDRAKRGEITEEEFRTARQQIIALHAQENTTVEEQARLAALDELYGLGYGYDKTFDSRIEAVSREEVVRAARKYLTHHVLATTSPQDDPGTGEKQGPASK